MSRTAQILKDYGFEPDKSVATMTEEQLYDLVKFACMRAISHESI